MATIAFKALSVFGGLIGGAIDLVNHLTGKNKKETDHHWERPSATDHRSPCPMLNALANHGYLPRDGKNVSLADLIVGFRDAINLAPDATLIVGLKALQASSTGKLVTLNLDDLAKHGIIEHDGSLTRHDIYSGDNHTFSPELFAAFISHFPAEGLITLEAAARTRKERLATAKTTNPEFSMSDQDEQFSSIETSSYLLVFGQGPEWSAPTEWIRTFFQEEKLPIEQGWRRSDKVLGTGDLFAVKKKVDAVA